MTSTKLRNLLESLKAPNSKVTVEHAYQLIEADRRRIERNWFIAMSTAVILTMGLFVVSCYQSVE